MLRYAPVIALTVASVVALVVPIEEMRVREFCFYSLREVLLFWMYGLSERETEVLELILQGKNNQNIASSLQLSPSTVKVHVHNILKKTELKNRQELTQDFWKH